MLAFCANILCPPFAPIFCAKKLHNQNVTIEKLCKALLYKKFAPKMLMKLTIAASYFLRSFFFALLIVCAVLMHIQGRLPTKSLIFLRTQIKISQKAVFRQKQTNIIFICKYLSFVFRVKYFLCLVASLMTFA